MPAFHYIAVDQQGQEKKGVLEADNEKHARQMLRNQSLLPVKVSFAHKQKNQAKKGALLSLFSRKQRLSIKDLALFTRQFATLLAASLPVEEALQAVAEQSDKPEMKALILAVRSKVLEGHALAQALADFPEAFPPLFSSTVAAGEKTGQLDKVLLRLADYTEQQHAMKQKLKTALIYPSMIILVAFGIVGFLLEYVVPKMIKVYSSLKQDLPGLTKVLIAISNFIQSWGLYLILALVIGGFVWWRIYKKTPTLQFKVHLWLLKLPLIGNARKTADTARFSRTLAILSAAGVPVLDAMQIASKLVTTLPIRQSIQSAVDRVREGTAIHLALKETGYFSPMAVHMMASGEASGQLEAMLERVAKTQEDDIVRLIDVSLALFEPAVILLMGVVVLFIVLAVLMPIFQLNEFS
jgi:general secretion pathway protein F